MGFTEGLRGTKIGCVGAGYVGGPTMAMIAYQCPDIDVTLYDLSEARIAAWNSDDLPIYEPGLEDLVKACRGRNLFFTTNGEQMVKDCDIIFVSVNTPTKDFGLGRGAAADLSYCESTARMIAKHAESNKIIVEKSTVPVRTAEALASVLNANDKSQCVKFVILSNPEFLAEGTAIRDLKCPDRVLVGGQEHSEDGSAAMEILVAIYARWVPRDKILTTNIWSSELSKLVANAFLAQRISSINAVSALCEKTEADVRQVAKAIGHDTRIGAKFLNASVGFGGSCFQKDLLNLVYICGYYNLPEVAEYWRQVILMNDFQKSRFTTNIIHSMFSTVCHKKIAILGFAYKKDTGDTRQTPALDVCAKLMSERACLSIYDPKVTREAALKEFAVNGLGSSFDFDRLFQFTSCAEDACSSAHAILVLTEWEEFKSLDYKKIYASMEKPAFAFDGRNILDHAELSRIGFRVKGVGVPFPE